MNKPAVLGGAAVALAIVAGTAFLIHPDGRGKAPDAVVAASAASGRDLPVIDPAGHARLQASLEKAQARIQELEAGPVPVPIPVPTPDASAPEVPDAPASAPPPPADDSPVRIFSSSSEQCGLDDAVAWFLKKHGLPESAGEALRSVLRQEMDAYAAAVAQWLEVQKAAHPGLSTKDILFLASSHDALMGIREEVRGRFTGMLQGSVPAAQADALSEIFRSNGSRVGITPRGEVCLDWDTAGKGLESTAIWAPVERVSLPSRERITQALDKGTYLPIQEASKEARLSEAQSKELSGACREILDARSQLGGSLPDRKTQERIWNAVPTLVRLLGQEKAQEVLAALMQDAGATKP